MSVLSAMLQQPWPKIWLDEVDSTNAEAMRRVSRGDLGPVWIAARQQSAGRGRRGRTWISEKGNLFTSALFPFDDGPEKAALICFSTCLALGKALEDVGAPSEHIKFKWPNDLRWKARKLSGILIETSFSGTGIFPVCVGIGVNLVGAPDTDQLTASLKDMNTSTSTEHMLDMLALRFQEEMILLLNTGFDGVRSRWLSRAEGLGERVVVNTVENTVEGEFETIDTEGAMILRGKNGQRHRVTAGDVQLLEDRT